MARSTLSALTCFLVTLSFLRYGLATPVVVGYELDQRAEQSDSAYQYCSPSSTLTDCLNNVFGPEEGEHQSLATANFSVGPIGYSIQVDIEGCNSLASTTQVGPLTGPTALDTAGGLLEYIGSVEHAKDVVSIALDNARLGGVEAKEYLDSGSLQARDDDPEDAESLLNRVKREAPRLINSCIVNAVGGTLISFGVTYWVNNAFDASMSDQVIAVGAIALASLFMYQAIVEWLERVLQNETPTQALGRQIWAVLVFIGRSRILIADIRSQVARINSDTVVAQMAALGTSVRSAFGLSSTPDVASTECQSDSPV